MNVIPPLMPYGPPCGHTSIILGLSNQLFQKRTIPQNSEEDALMDALKSISPASVLLHGCTEYCRVLSSCFPSHGLRFIGEGGSLSSSNLVSSEGRGEMYLRNLMSGFESLSTTQESPFGTLESLENALKLSLSPSNNDTQREEDEEILIENDELITQYSQMSMHENTENDLKPPPAKRRGPKKKLFKEDLLQQEQEQHHRAILGSTVLKGEEGSTAVPSRNRVILVLPLNQNISYESELEMHTLANGNIIDIRKTFNKIITMEHKPPCDLFIVRVDTMYTTQHIFQKIDTREHAFVKLSDFPTYMTNLSARQCCLMKVVISGINIRMLNSNSTSGNNVVTHTSGTASFWAQGFPEHAISAPVGMNMANREQTELLLQWKQPYDSMTTEPAPDSLPCSCIHRVTPAYSDDPVSQMVLNHVLSGKGVLLGTESSKITHSLQVHANGVVYMHCCRDVELALTDAVRGVDGPFIFDCSECKNYPTRDFFELIDSNLLFHKKTTESIPDLVPIVTSEKDPPVLTPILAERYTRFFPWEDKNSIFQGKETYEELKNLLDQIRKVITLPKIDPPAFALGKYSFEKLAECAASNNPRLFPPLRSSATARKKAYQKLCEEVFLFVKSCDTTTEHHKFMELLGDLLPSELIDLKKVALCVPQKCVDCEKSKCELPVKKEDDDRMNSENTRKVKNNKSLLGDDDSLLAIFWDFINN